MNFTLFNSALFMNQKEKNCTTRYSIQTITSCHCVILINNNKTASINDHLVIIYHILIVIIHPKLVGVCMCNLLFVFLSTFVLS